ncbi:Glycoprotein 3-alpha-L-fucosyltransferase A [Folsomia candida]|uniref:Fucosyltransferase n=1 Tax=Folsomia candida TaxID=158441 RepID=A0A226F587_FOLCA|nr:Glycoprotein 3-alpha-L-fucosyltransferase A [Folsomia candida]
MTPKPFLAGIIKNITSDQKERNLELEEMFQIVATTPNLWGYRTENMKNNSTLDRIYEQRKWISRISQTEFIKRVLPDENFPDSNVYSSMKSHKKTKCQISERYDDFEKSPKQITVYLEPGDAYVYTNNSVSCPFAPEFEGKCSATFVALEWREMFRKPVNPYLYKYNHVDAVVGIRNGFWGEDEIFPEQNLPSGTAQIFYQIESPSHTGSARLGQTGAWLASYWRGSDIPVLLYELMEKTGGGQDGVYEQLPNYEEHLGVRKLVAGLISNCYFVKNDRLGYIHQLEKYMRIDLYGRCGNLTCPENCTTFLQQNYKFYLAFENCNCEDYVTEKFFMTAILNGIVPVVMGPSRQSYESFAPPSSFIHVDDFASPKELAQYLEILDKNDTLYQNYFAWRRKPGPGWIISHRSGQDFFCRVCGQLYYADFVPPPPWPTRETRFSDVNPCSHTANINMTNENNM